MPSSSSPKKSVVCDRCQKQLSGGMTYCVACGFQNDADGVINRQLEFQSHVNKLNKLNKRRDFLSLLRKLFYFLRIG